MIDSLEVIVIFVASIFVSFSLKSRNKWRLHFGKKSQLISTLHSFNGKFSVRDTFICREFRDWYQLFHVWINLKISVNCKVLQIFQHQLGAVTDTGIKLHEISCCLSALYNCKYIFSARTRYLVFPRWKRHTISPENVFRYLLDISYILTKL